MADRFVIHPSVFNDAFRTDYTTPFRDSSRAFLNELRNNWITKETKIGFTSGEVFAKLLKSQIGKTHAIWIIPEHIVAVDWETYVNPSEELSIDQSIARLTAKLGIKHNPRIVTTSKIDLEGASFHTMTPKEALDFYRHPNSQF